MWDGFARRQNSTMIELLGNAAGVEALWSRRDIMTVDIASIQSTRDGIGRWLQSTLYGGRGNSAVGAMFFVGVAGEAYSFVDTVVLTIPQTNQRIELQVGKNSPLFWLCLARENFEFQYCLFV